MVSITASCPRHGAVRCTPGAVRLYVAADTTDEIRYSFPCPGCGGLVHKPAHWRDVPVLAAAGIRLEVDPAAPPVAAPLTYDDLISFHFWLEGNDCLVASLVG